MAGRFLSGKEYKRWLMEEEAGRASEWRLRQELQDQRIAYHFRRILHLNKEMMALKEENRRLHMDRSSLLQQLQESRHSSRNVSSFVSQVHNLTNSPDTILVAILQHLHVCHLQRVSRVCQRWKKLMDEAGNNVHKSPTIELSSMAGLCPNKALDRALDIVRNQEEVAARCLTIIGHQRLFTDMQSCQMEDRPSSLSLDFAGQLPSLHSLLIVKCSLELRQLLTLPHHLQRVQLVDTLLCDASLTASVHYHPTVWLNVRIQNRVLAGWSTQLDMTRQLLLRQVLDQALLPEVRKRQDAYPRLAKKLRQFRHKKTRMQAVFHILKDRERDYCLRTSFSQEDLDAIDLQRLRPSTVAELHHLAYKIHGRPGKGKGWAVTVPYPLPLHPPSH
ncbi:hypothetical protein RvY_18122 [Ramazzottius varieornatus]|uniref:F-box domain-containing protein n=1 Tax=Ramazzottius varieornatus TaxID=947166 RepID=A0A1D1W9X4_RAMVA|nr:hypothetical protein RvY_18122 [Ramazzottius varieornatus]